MERTTVFVLGNSISLHYAPFLKKIISNKYHYSQRSGVFDALQDLEKPIGANAGDSNRVLEYLRENYNKGITYNILLLNCGLHDTRVEDYISN